MNTPLEQIKERLEKMKRHGQEHICGTDYCPECSEVSDYNQAISDVQELLPSIIQEVVDACISVVENTGGRGHKEMERLKQKLFRDPDFKKTYDSLTSYEVFLRKDISDDLSSLKEESK